MDFTYSELVKKLLHEAAYNNVTSFEDFQLDTIKKTETLLEEKEAEIDKLVFESSIIKKYFADVINAYIKNRAPLLTYSSCENALLYFTNKKTIDDKFNKVSFDMIVYAVLQAFFSEEDRKMYDFTLTDIYDVDHGVKFEFDFNIEDKYSKAKSAVKCVVPLRVDNNLAPKYEREKAGKLELYKQDSKHSYTIIGSSYTVEEMNEISTKWLKSVFKSEVSF